MERRDEWLVRPALYSEAFQSELYYFEYLVDGRVTRFMLCWIWHAYCLWIRKLIAAVHGPCSNVSRMISEPLHVLVERVENMPLSFATLIIALVFGLRTIQTPILITFSIFVLIITEPTFIGAFDFWFASVVLYDLLFAQLTYPVWYMSFVDSIPTYPQFVNITTGFVVKTINDYVIQLY